MKTAINLLKTIGPRDLLQQYIEMEAYKKYYRAYARNAKLCYYLWNILMFVSIMAGFASSIIAALVKSNDLSGTWRSALIVVPILGSIAVVLLSQLRLFDQFRIWEGGRREFDQIVADGRRRLTGATTDAECTQIHADVIKQVVAADQLFTNKLSDVLSRQDTIKKKANLPEEASDD